MPLHQKYRPDSLSKIIGHEKAVGYLRGCVESDKFPSAIMFIGPASVGKTTLARAFANDVLGENVNGSPNWFEINLADNRSIEDIRSMVQISRLRPQNGSPRRFLLGDEAQGVLGNAPAANAFLKPLEEPVSTTTFLLGTMDPDKFRSTQIGKAISTRCIQLRLDPPSDEEITKQAKRIIRGEGLKFFTAEVLEAVVRASDSSMRSLANVIERIAGYHASLRDAPDKLSAEDVVSVLSTDSSDDEAAKDFLAAVYLGQMVGAQKALLRVSDAVTFIGKVTWLAWFMLNNEVLKGARHPKVWGSKNSGELVKKLSTSSLAERSEADRVRVFATVSSGLTRLRLQSGAFAVDETMALSSYAFDTIRILKEEK